MKAKPPQVVVAGHICLDIIPSLGPVRGGLESLLRPGRLIHTGKALIATGGSVANTGLALHRLGVPVRLMGKIGDNLFGSGILELLRRRDPALAQGMIVVRGDRTSYTIVLSPSGFDRVFLHCPGANDTFVADDMDWAKARGAKILHFGYPPLMRRMYRHGGRELASAFRRAKREGLTASLDMARPDPDSEAGRVDWLAWLKRVLPYVDIFLPSLEEILFMLDRRRYERLARTAGETGLISRVDSSLLTEVSDCLLEMGAAMVALKLGDQGIYLRTTPSVRRLESMGRCTPSRLDRWAHRQLLSPCFAAKVIGTTGSGDCAIAGFLAALLRGTRPEEAIRSAVAVGSCSVEQADATSAVPRWSLVQARIRGGWPRLPVHITLPGWRWSQSQGVWAAPADALHKEDA